MLEEFPMLYLRASQARRRFKMSSDSLSAAVTRHNQLRARYFDESPRRYIWDDGLNDFHSEIIPIEAPSPFAEEIASAVAVLLTDDDQRDIYRVIFGAVERTVVGQVIERFRGNTVKTAAALGITRNRLRRRMQALKMKLSVEVRIPEPSQ